MNDDNSDKLAGCRGLLIAALIMVILGAMVWFFVA
jgi:hypothetical protein